MPIGVILIILFSIIVILVGLGCIGVGIYLLIYGNIGNMTIPEIGRYLTLGTGVLISIVAIGLIIYVYLSWNRKAQRMKAKLSEDKISIPTRKSSISQYNDYTTSFYTRFPGNSNPNNSPRYYPN